VFALYVDVGLLFFVGVVFGWWFDICLFMGGSRVWYCLVMIIGCLLCIVVVFFYLYPWCFGD